MAHLPASREEVEAFLRETEFTGYQSVPLPHGLAVPGADRSQHVDAVLGGRVEGRSVLDLGTYYGLFPCEAMRVGARRAVGVEMDPAKYRVARQIARLNGDAYEIHLAEAESFRTDERFDVVLLLNVLHHVDDPIAAVASAAALSQDLVVVEFCVHNDPMLLRELHPGAKSRCGSRLLARFHAQILAIATRGVPVVAVGSRPYHRTYFFSPAAFHNMFVLHNGIFSDITFLPSVKGSFRRLAICTVAR